MSTTVSDVSGNRNDKIVNAAKVLGRSSQRIELFQKVYSGKKVKSVSELMRLTGYTQVRVLQLAKGLASEDIILQIKIRGQGISYKKIDFYNIHRNTIVRLARNKDKLEKVPTKVNPIYNGKGAAVKIEHLSIAKKMINAIELTIDDLNFFKKISKFKTTKINIEKLSETDFKNGIKKIIGEPGVFKDWGGEVNDLLTTKVLYKDRRIRTAFAFKGPGKKGKLTPARMGKNGDQIQRLFNSPAELFIIQYWDQIDQSVIDQVQTFAKLKSIMEGKKIYYCIIDGHETKRIVEAYRLFFPKKSVF
ncbi:hypothetical protein SAMN04488109_0406 [Chryseolinea serpens]|uniref:Uncharacterized protein n=1 Tax=Chryseolinea serpens TaxID=947013 RepID=A0A1M5K219_9BACT|nr:hypothetical protein [Chryseolinea serpens]SHG46765.1 hypothetical protein SAMN04488109_0406 [Chryseolinea serpens]